jgi:phosphoribosylanthranilate isomerase
MHRKFVLAGGLNESNVQEGMKLFSPDVVDVSSGVEVENGKDKTKINNFVRKVRNYE